MGCTGELLSAGLVRQPDENPLGLGAIRRPFAVKIRHENGRDLLGAGSHCQICQPGRIRSDPAGDRVGDLGGIERANKGQEGTRCIGEASDGTRDIGRSLIRLCVHRARCSERKHDVTNPESEAERCTHIVTGSWADNGGGR